jgi:hypothetical protein
MTEGNAAIHAARALFLQFSCRVREIDLSPVVNPLGDGPRRLLLAMDFEEACDFSHALVGGSKDPPLRRKLQNPH